MGFLDSVRAWLGREASEVKASVDALEDRLDDDLTRRERELSASPEEKMRMIQEDTGADDALAAIQDKIDSAQAHADATADLIDPQDDPTDDPIEPTDDPDDPTGG